MRIHPLAMLAILTATVATGCGSAREVRDSKVHANALGCDQCHGYPPPPFFPADAGSTHPTDLTPAMCTVCHPATVLADGHTINATLIDDGSGNLHIAHRDGQVEAIDYKTVSCDSCHALPPDTGHHAFHVVTRGVACATCHRDFDPVARTADDTVHMMGVDYIVLEDGTHLTKVAEADGTWPDAECNTCHTQLGVGGP
jgi:hypothetical protein